MPALTATILSPAIARASAIAASMPPVTNVNGASGWGQSSGAAWVTTTTGRPSGWLPCQPFVKSNSRRPTTSTPVRSRIAAQCAALSGVSISVMPGSAVGTLTSPLPYHWNSWSKPLPS